VPVGPAPARWRTSRRAHTGRVSADELVVLVDENGHAAGAVPRSQMRAGHLLHAATAVLVRDSADRIYLHRRTDTKDWAPGHWDAAAGGVMQAGEEPSASAARELAEELGITGVELHRLGQHLFEDATLRCFEYTYEVRYDGPVSHQPSEVAEGRWVAMDELARVLAGPLPFVSDTRQLLDSLAADGVGDYAQLRVFAAALRLGLDFTATRHGPVRSLAQAAAVRGIDPHQILKSMVVRLSRDEHCIVLVPGDRQISWPKLRALLGVNRISLTDAEDALAVTGYVRGTITPLGSRTPLRVIVDTSASGEVSLGAGAQGLAMSVSVQALIAALEASVADVT